MSKSNTYSISITGRRDSNQDACLDITRGSLTFLAVADGMGGTRGGEIASQTVIEVCKTIIDGLEEKPITAKHLKAFLKKIFKESGKQLKLLMDEKPELRDMGTTLSCLVLLDNCFAWGNIGDSRIYHYKNKSLHQLTIDHTLIESYRNEYGEKIPEYIRARSNVITRCLGGDDDKPDIFPSNKEYETIEEGEAFLICSDGLLPEKVESETAWIVKFLTGTKTLEQAAKHMVNHAFHQGSTDNISVVLYEHGAIERKIVVKKNCQFPPREQAGKKKGRFFKNLFRLSLFVLIAVLTGLIGYLIFGTIKENNFQHAPLANPKIKAAESLNQPLNITSLSWDPASKLRGGFPLRISSDVLSWDAYPDNHLVDKYEMRFMPKGGAREVQLETERLATQIHLDGTGLLPGDYSLIIKAVLSNGEIIRGEEVNITLTR